jgi:GTPase SAR1 family protein
MKEVVEYIHKILIVGDCCVGKTSFIHRLISDSFTTQYKATVKKKQILKNKSWVWIF